ncbi:SRPBCC family protein [Nocardia mexicana]|uniref:Polyketide cyclase/dehydrase/lipid transport protein n=1 Tax=Nocardia mexicana TaxID=279262 RepID=A0A370HGT1_9NOCA|nr:SRPBCC family protein [Nocardia mexicana]RDI54374.1 polyketide cyclase/dehydrase/lipid transport protein [Nocardia mexicana]
MASVYKEIVIQAPPEQVWAVLADFAEGPVRMAPGFVTESRVESPDTRVVTFSNGTVVHERRITLDEGARRFVYSVYGGTVPIEHDNASWQVFPEGEGGTRFVWSRDLLPDALAEPFGASMEYGMKVFKETMESRPES